jgi:O-antigen/teichoic acid export membrane protein
MPARRNSIASIVVMAWTNPLVRNGYALIAAAGATAVLGLVFWILAARSLPATEVGLGAALVSLMMTVSNIAQINLGNVLNRYLPVAGAKTGKFIAGAYFIASVVTALLAIGTIATLGFFAPNLLFLKQSPLLMAFFVASTIFWTICTLQDATLTGLRRAAVVPIENTAYALAKILALVALPGVVSFAPGVFAAWASPLPLLALVISTVIFVKFVPNRERVGPDNPVSTRGSLVRFWFFDYIGSVSFMAAIGLAPIIVLRFSDLPGVANYHLSWTISYTLYQIGRSMGSSLVTEAMTDDRSHHLLLRQTIKFTMIPLIVAVVVVIVAAPWIMAMFGKSYIAGAALLRLLALSCIPSGLISIYIADARIQGRLEWVAFIQALSFVSLMVLGFGLVPAIGSVGMGLAWLISNTSSLLIVMLLIYLSGRRL